MSLKGEWLEWHFLEQKMTRKRRSFGSGFKAKVAVEAVRGLRTLSQQG